MNAQLKRAYTSDLRFRLPELNATAGLGRHFFLVANGYYLEKQKRMLCGMGGHVGGDINACWNDWLNPCLRFSKALEGFVMNDLTQGSSSWG